jgi:hypothetical protein
VRGGSDAFSLQSGPSRLCVRPWRLGLNSKLPVLTHGARRRPSSRIGQMMAIQRETVVLNSPPENRCF